MSEDDPNVRTVNDLDRAVRALAKHFKTNTVIIVGSQSVLVGWPGAPREMKTSGEIDAYPANARAWELANPGLEASEEINALFGQGSDFHKAHGFYIDGVDEGTAKLPPDWKGRAVGYDLRQDGAQIRVIAPCTEDMVVAKLHRLVEKDVCYIKACDQARALDLKIVRERLLSCNPPPEIVSRAAALFKELLTRRKAVGRGKAVGSGKT